MAHLPLQLGMTDRLPSQGPELPPKSQKGHEAFSLADDCSEQTNGEAQL